MSAKHFSKVRSLFKFTLLFGAVTVLSYCTTSPDKTASSFGKRKYTKGHFSDPVAKVKMEYKPDGEKNMVGSANTNKSDVSGNNIPVKPSGNKNTEPVFTATTNAVVASSNNQAQQKGIAITKNDAGSAANNVSLKENTSGNAYPYSDQGHPYQHRDDRSSTYLIGWIISLGIALLCILLFAGWAASLTGSTAATAGTGCLLLSVFSLASILAIVFFILWIVAIS